MRAIRGKRLQELSSCNDSEVAAELRQEVSVRSDPLLPVLGEGAGKGEDRVVVIDEGTGMRVADQDDMVIPEDEMILFFDAGLLFPEGNLCKRIG